MLLHGCKGYLKAINNLKKKALRIKKYLNSYKNSIKKGDYLKINPFSSMSFSPTSKVSFYNIYFFIKRIIYQTTQAFSSKKSIHFA